jgi:ribosome-associated protein
MPRIAYSLDPADLQWQAIRAQGAGGQNINKVSNAAQLRFDVRAARLPAALKADGVLTIKAQEHRSLERNRAEALARLTALLDEAAYTPPARRATRPTLSAQRQRVEGKLKRGQVKAARRRIDE